MSPAGDLTYVGHVGPSEHQREDAGSEVFRSLTIGEDLWTLSGSYSRLDRRANWLLQSYDLATLERKSAVAQNDRPTRDWSAGTHGRSRAAHS